MNRTYLMVAVLVAGLGTWGLIAPKGTGPRAAGDRLCRSNHNPVANIQVPPQAAMNQPVIFDGSGSYDPDSRQYLRYVWDFGDGQVQNGRSQITHSYSAAGVYTVSLTVRDDCEGVDLTSVNLTIDSPYPYITILSAADDNGFGCAAALITFAVTGTQLGGFGKYFARFYVDGGPIPYEFYNGTVNDVYYDGTPAADAHWVSPDSLTINVSPGPHTIRAVLAKTGREDPNSEDQFDFVMGPAHNTAGSFRKTYAISQYTDGVYAAPTGDGGYLLLGSDRYRIWLVKTDANGETCDYTATGECQGTGVFAKLLTRTNITILPNFAAETNNGFLIAATQLDYDAGVKALLIKTDQNGNTCNFSTGACASGNTFVKEFPGDANSFEKIVVRADGSFVAAGTKTVSASDATIWLASFNAQGTLQWEKTYGSSPYARGYSVNAPAGGGYLITGTGRRVYPSGTAAVVRLIKTDAQGNTCTSLEEDCVSGALFSQMYPGTYSTSRLNGIEIPGHGFAFTAGFNRIELFKTALHGETCSAPGVTCDDTVSGEPIFARRFDGSNAVSGYSRDVSVWPTHNSSGVHDGYVIGGFTKDFPMDPGISSIMWIIKTDLQGNTCDYQPDGDCYAESSGQNVFSKLYPSTDYTGMALVRQTDDGGYLILGTNLGMDLIRTDPRLHICP